MLIRAYQPQDIEEAKQIFDKFYANGRNGQLEFPNMTENYLCAFTIKGDDDKIVTTGGVRTILEVTLITDKSRNVRERVQALREALRASSYIARQFRFNWLHAVTDDSSWSDQLKRNGFASRGEELEIHVGDIR